MYLKLFHLRGLRGRKQITLLKQTFARYFRLVKVQSSSNFKSIARTSLVVEFDRFDLVKSQNIFNLVLHFIGNAPPSSMSLPLQWKDQSHANWHYTF